MAPKLTIYCDPCTINSHKVLGALKEMKVDYDFKKVDYFAGEQKSEAVVKINPSATVPFAVVDDTVITESNAILAYAADTQPNDAYYPKDLVKRAQVNRWLLWESSVWFASCYVYAVENVVKPLLGAQPDPKVIEGEADRHNKLCKILDDQLAKNRFICGDHITIADFAIAAPMHLYPECQLPIDSYPNLKRWQQKEMEHNKAWMDTQEAVLVLAPGRKKAQTNGTSTTGESVKAMFNYTKDLKNDPPTIYFYEDPKSEGLHIPGDDPREVTVYNGWSRAKEFDVDKHGFALSSLKTKFDDWEAEDKVSTELYPEIVDFLKQQLGAKRVLVFDHTIRAARNEGKKLTQETNTSQRAPVQLVHCDYTAESGPLRVKQLLPNEADDLLKRRVAFINVWKPIKRVVEERPLAMCDVTTSSPDDFMKLFLHYRDRIGENYVMRYSDKQRWYYFPKITPEQVILLKTYDSEKDVAQFVGHSAFIDPTSAPDAPMRESVEIRTICFF